jgi:subtilisin family serine protease
MQNAVLYRALGQTEGEGIFKFTFIPYLSVFADAAQLARLLGDPRVVNVREDVPVAMTAVSDRPRVLDHYATAITEAEKLWAKGYTGGGQTVAVLDTGIDPAHPMFAGKVVAEACFSTRHLPDASPFCPGGVTESTKKGSAIYCPLILAFCDHGTNVSSIAVGSSAVLKGFAPGADLIAIQVFSRGNDAHACGRRPAPCVTFYDTDVMSGLNYVFTLHSKFAFKIAAANLSLGGTHYSVPCDADYPDLTAAIYKLKLAGIATTAAAGNDGHLDKIDHPACISYAVAVASSDSRDERSPFSDFSSQVRMFSPGTAVDGALPLGKYGKDSGTSQATPGVTRALAIMQEIAPAAPLDLRVNSLQCGGQPILTINGDTKGRIDLLRAYHYLEQPPTATAQWGRPLALGP